MTDTQRVYWRHPDLGARRLIDVPGGPMAVHDAGAGAPIVFVHGFAVNANLWRKVVGELSGEFRCIAVDLPLGSHELPMPAADLTIPGLAGMLAAAIAALGLGPVTLVGNDSGDAVCQVLATTRPDLVAGLVLTSGDAYDNCPPQAFRFLKLLARVPGGIAALATTLRMNTLRRLPIAYGWLTRRPIDPRAFDSYCLPMIDNAAIRSDTRRVLAGLNPRVTLAAAQRFGEFDRPVLIAWSREDKFFPTAHAEQLARDFPDARLEWVDDSYTFSPEDKPQRLTALIRAFVGSPRPQGSPA
ncbi:MAG: alpha/beta hydrolase [Mycobacteriaceae bacterium]|nr:alpha/beta hydrolase [Mycobacteriaceae bacterium]